MVQIVRKVALPGPGEVSKSLRLLAEQAHSIVLREPRPEGSPLLFTADLQLIEPVVAFLHEHGVQRAHTADTVRTYAEILYDWFETLEQNSIDWVTADAVDLVAYRNRMMSQPSLHTGRLYRVSTINHRVRGVLRFYEWAVRTRWVDASPLVGKSRDFAVAERRWPNITQASDRSLFVLRQFEVLPRPLTSEQACELLATLRPPYDLMARWQLYTGLRVSELLRLNVETIRQITPMQFSHQTIEIMRKGRKPGYVIAPISLLDESSAYVTLQRRAWLERARRRAISSEPLSLFVNALGRSVAKNTYQGNISRAGQACGFKATTHLLRSTFACMLLARLERLASQGAAINPLLVVKVLMGHEHIETTDRYLRAIAVDEIGLKGVLDTLLSHDKSA